jgi:hypothetical protein
MTDRIYEEERLLLEVQETIAEAIHRSGLNRTEIAERLGKNRSFVTQALSTGRNLTLASIAGLAWAAGFRLKPTLQVINVRAQAEAPEVARPPSARNSANIVSLADRLSTADIVRQSPKSQQRQESHEPASNVA